MKLESAKFLRLLANDGERAQGFWKGGRSVVPPSRSLCPQGSQMETRRTLRLKPKKHT